MKDVSPLRQLRNDTSDWVDRLKFKLPAARYAREQVGAQVREIEKQIKEGEADLARIDVILNTPLPEEDDEG